MSFRPENEARGEAAGGPPDGESPEAREAPPEERERGWLASRPGPAPLVVGLLLFTLLVGIFLLWRSYGDLVGGTSVYENTVESGPEPTVRLTNGPGRVSVEGVEGLENVEITAKRYARGFNSTAARENADEVPVDVGGEGSAVEISSDGGDGTGVDFDLRVPAGSVVVVESAVGDVEVWGLDNDATVHAEAGDISMQDVRGSVMVEAPRGDVEIERMSTETGNAEITVGSGDVELRDLVLGILEARVEAGDVTLSGRFSGSGRIFVETGSINARLPSEDVKDLELETRVGEVLREEQGSR